MTQYIPFNENTAVRDIKTTNYTIPSGQYGFVHFLAYDTDCTIDADVVIPTLSVTDTQTLSATNTNIYAPPTGYAFKGYVNFFESSVVGGELIRFGLRSSSTDYWMTGVNYLSSTTYVVNNLAHVGAALTSSCTFTILHGQGYFPIDIPSGTTLSFASLGTSVSTTVMVHGMLQQPIGAQHIFHVTEGNEIIGSKFEVTLFNKA